MLPIYQYTCDHLGIILLGLCLWFFCSSRIENRINKSKKCVYGLWKVVLFFVMCIFLGIFLSQALFDRIPSVDRQYELELFWSYKDAIKGITPGMKEQIFLNILAFVPLGNVFYYLVGEKKKFWKVLFIVGIITISVECIQLYFGMGLFEFDDIFDNTLGGIIGILIAKLGEKDCKKSL